ncbi:SDR family oxidoreductase [Actinomadura roseirufa]|uniref:SDR family oxidoreductase n=1 Tax=Actinomadura roseirufa TaxID=2094049 RepID=UPI001F5FA0BC|nr:SDR family oxidoreductase [Actinomadura roseirufa]
MASDGVELAVRERGEGNDPTVVLVHGYPDTGAMWDEVAERLAGRFRVLSYDVRGAGASTAPADPLAYRLDALVGDLAAVLDGAGADRPVHLVGHDWGSVQGWEAVIGDRLRGRIASFTSISGPDRRHMAQWVGESVRSGPSGVVDVLDQALRSAYMPVLRAPRAGELVARLLPVTFARGLKRREGTEPRPGHPAPTLPRDARNGLGLYRANLGRGGLPGGDGSTDVPVQLIVPVRDRYGSEPLLLSARGHASRLYVRRAPGGHWVARSHPDLVARWVAEFAGHIEGAPESTELARARAAGGGFGGRLVVVTGAGSGIGRATARAFAAEGARVVVADLDGDAAAATAAELPGEAHPYEVDVSDAEAMERFARDVRDSFGVPDIVVNNAGLAMAGSLLDTSEEDWALLRSVNVDGVYRGCRLFGRQMADRGEGGHLVVISSMSALVPSVDTPAYGATKAAVLHLSECLRLDLERHGIGVTAICPGVINTPISQRMRFAGHSADSTARMRKVAARGLERYGDSPEKVARAVLRAVRRDVPVAAVGREATIAALSARGAGRAARSLTGLAKRLDERR